MNSKKSRKLFKRAISQSGTLKSFWADPLRKGLAKERATKLAGIMDCPIESTTEETIECLRKVPADKIINAVRDFMVRSLFIVFIFFFLNFGKFSKI